MAEGEELILGFISRLNAHDVIFRKKRGGSVASRTDRCYVGGGIIFDLRLNRAASDLATEGGVHWRASALKFWTESLTKPG